MELAVRALLFEVDMFASLSPEEREQYRWKGQTTVRDADEQPWQPQAGS